MNLHPRTEQITVQKEFLFATAGLIHKVGNVTLDGATFEGVVKAGTVVVENPTTKISTAYNGASYTPAAGIVYVTAHDVEVADKNVQVGAIEEAYLHRTKITGYHADLAVDSENRFKIRG
jgi:hypothetical protein